MGKIGGFLEHDRQEPGYRPREERLGDFRAVELRLPDKELHQQAARCMGCGIPFCHGAGCPVDNVIPEFNDMAYRGKWREALDILLSTNPFPEFTSRICPAPCEAACVLELSNGQPVAIREIEKAVIETGFERGYLKPRPPAERTGRRVAVVGSGPAGLAAAQILNQFGHSVVVYDKSHRPGGILRYGIPDFKLEKWVVDRRVKLMADEGVEFENDVTVGVDISYRYLETRFDAVVLAAGSRQPRDLAIPGRELKGVHYAMEFLMAQNRKLAGETVPPEKDIVAKNKHVLVIGGGDTGSDCVGTSLRQGARSVTQIEIMPKPPEERSESTPWPQWPLKLRTSSSHKEGGWRLWQVSATSFTGNGQGGVAAAQCVEMNVDFQNGRPVFSPRPGSEFAIEAELVFLAMGFVGPAPNPMLDQLGIARTPRGEIAVDGNYMTSVPGIFAAGDMARGQSLVVRAIADGRKAALRIDQWLKAKK
ncbi:MAG: glutamate synthase subunit beta [Rhodospirillales bacterium]|jgi:glutamate synthase (NADPH/NADH) small chain|nr:glutamate synthase subunit beta [Rhodospirillales bacterium]